MGCGGSKSAKTDEGNKPETAKEEQQEQPQEQQQEAAQWALAKETSLAS